MVRRGFAAIVVSLLLSLMALSLIVYALEVDAVARLVYVVDGDTVKVRILKVYDEKLAKYISGFYGRLRLADIDAPELNTPEGKIAASALRSLLAGHTIVFIDVDDLYVFDKYGRIVGVLLIPYNETHLLNVNMWLLVKGYARVWDYPNEFNPREWSLFEPKSIIPGSKQTPTKTKTATTTSTQPKTVTVTRTMYITMYKMKYSTITRYIPRTTITKTIYKTVYVTQYHTITSTVIEETTYTVTKTHEITKTLVKTTTITSITPVFRTVTITKLVTVKELDMRVVATAVIAIIASLIAAILTIYKRILAS